jgi:adenosylcobinamide kinase / adenosylcobinamide-phosphate guanylyltransferase
MTAITDRPLCSFVFGGARSGKTREALRLAEASGKSLVYVATAQAFDDEMRERIAHHRDERGAAWTTIEEPLDLAGTITRQANADRLLLVDCLTLWLTNVVLGEHDVAVYVAALKTAIAQRAGPLVLVSNEVGLGIVPDNALARRFRDEQGRLNQIVAALADRVTLMAAGLPLQLKG